MSLYSQLAELLSYVAPKLYKVRFFKKLESLNASNVLERHVEPELLWLATRLDKNDVVLDVGSNVGAYLYLLEKAVRPENLYGFEPNQSLYRRLKRIFPNLKIYPLALSDQNRVADFKVPVIQGAALKSRGTLQTAQREEGERKSRHQKVKTIRLDDWAPIEHFTRLDYIKIDVEGHEAKTLEGAKKTIARLKPTLLVEIEQRHHQAPVWPLIEQVCSWGYKAYYVKRETLKLERLERQFFEFQTKDDLKDQRHYINNIIFVPEK